MERDGDGRSRPDGGLTIEEIRVDSRTDPERFRHLVEHIQDAVVEFELVDGEPVVLTINPAFEAVFGYDADEIVGEPLNDYIVPPWRSEEADALDTRTTAGKVNYRHVRRETADGLGHFLYRGIPYETADGRAYGFAVYTDLTEDRRNESRLAVTNRLLRHNLRNEVNVIAGATGRLLDRLADGEAAEMAAKVDAAADRLLELTDEAEAVQETLEASVAADARVDCAALIERVAERFRAAHPDAEVRTDLPGRLEVAATERLEVAVAGLVENALQHNPAEEPWVRVTARPARDDWWAEIAVADDGPRIPRMEREVVTGGADITPVRHGSGLGLWLVKWTVERFGGDLSFEESAAGGNRVCLRLLRRTDAR